MHGCTVTTPVTIQALSPSTVTIVTTIVTATCISSALSPWHDHSLATGFAFRIQTLNVTNKHSCMHHQQHFSPVGGHYTAYALNPANSKWYEFDDERTSEISDPESRLISSKSYVLFYAKRGLERQASMVSTQSETDSTAGVDGDHAADVDVGGDGGTTDVGDVGETGELSPSATDLTNEQANASES
jgi:hypothetical protein